MCRKSEKRKAYSMFPCHFNDYVFMFFDICDIVGLLSLGDTALSASGSFDDKSSRKTPRSLGESMREKLKSRVQSAKVCPECLYIVATVG